MIYCIAQGTLLNIMQQIEWKKNLKRIDTFICITESPCCIFGTNTALQVNHTPIKIFFKQINKIKKTAKLTGLTILLMYI